MSKLQLNHRSEADCAHKSGHGLGSRNSLTARDLQDASDLLNRLDASEVPEEVLLVALAKPGATDKACQSSWNGNASAFLSFFIVLFSSTFLPFSFVFFGCSKFQKSTSQRNRCCRNRRKRTLKRTVSLVWLSAW